MVNAGPTKIMGILNVTPDSFFDGGRYEKAEAAIRQGLGLLDQGADILDVGGESTRPTSTPVSLDEELARVIPVIEGLTRGGKTPLSIDTMKPQVALAAVRAGATMINDVGGFRLEQMREVAANTGATICVMHMQGTPQTMQRNPLYPNGVVEEILDWFESQVALLVQEGIQENNIFLDPGIGFGKTVADNYEILNNIHRFRSLGFPLLLGISRKSLFSKVTGHPSDSSEVLASTLVMNALLMQAGVEIIRVHDVGAHKKVQDVLMTKNDLELKSC